MHNSSVKFAVATSERFYVAHAVLTAFPKSKCHCYKGGGQVANLSVAEFRLRLLSEPLDSFPASIYVSLVATISPNWKEPRRLICSS